MLLLFSSVSYTILSLFPSLLFSLFLSSFLFTFFFPLLFYGDFNEYLQILSGTLNNYISNASPRQT